MTQVQVTDRVSSQPHEEKTANSGSGFTPRSLAKALPQALRKLNPAHMVRTPVMFIVEMGALITIIVGFFKPSVFVFSLAIWLFLTVVFANLAEAVAEGRGKAQADALRSAKTAAVGRVRREDGSIEEVPAADLRPGDIVVVCAGETIPGDGDVVKGAATVDESAITG
ncbi:MAG: potassium-transporting ATPase subunit B, partial [Dermabacter sp.]|nr:potassium-transporting ATPase subunit B [Dermabacter sp.]